MTEKRYGRQTPTKSFVIPYEHTKGQEAIDLYNSTGRTAQEWQKLLVYDLLAYNNDDLWTHVKYGYAIPRRNGKNEVVSIREMWGLINGEQILHTAHRVSTSTSAFLRLCELLPKAGFKEKEDYFIYKQTGMERIEFPKFESKASFRTRTDKGGLGEGFDLIVIDEAQEYTIDQESSLKYVVSSSKNPQTILCGTPPTAVSSGTVFSKLREDVFDGATQDTGWGEWSVENMTDSNEVDAWYETNPSMGIILDERKVRAEITNDLLDFNIQRLGYWPKQNMKSFISPNEWNDLKTDKLPKLKGKLYVGIKYGKDGQNVAMSIACKTVSGKIFVETIDCQSRRNGDGWIVRFLKDACVENVVIDGAAGQQSLIDELQANKVKSKIILPKVGEVIQANDSFIQAINQKTLVHAGQPSLEESVTNCKKRAVGSNGGYAFDSIKESVDISIMDSVIFAHWSASVTKERRKQKVSY